MYMLVLKSEMRKGMIEDVREDVSRIYTFKDYGHLAIRYLRSISLVQVYDDVDDDDLYDCRLDMNMWSIDIAEGYE